MDLASLIVKVGIISMTLLAGLAWILIASNVQVEGRNVGFAMLDISWI
jgi:hypothetical protein